MKMQDEMRNKFSNLRNSKDLQPDPQFIKQTRQNLIQNSSTPHSNKKTHLLPIFSVMLLIPLCTILFLSFNSLEFINTTPSSSNNLKTTPVSKNETKIYIYHTHSRESFLPEIEKTKPEEAFDKKLNVVDVGSYLSSYLEEHNFKVKHDQTDFSGVAIERGDNYHQIYELSKENLTKFLNKEPANKNAIFLDIHRDWVDESATTTSINGKETARIIFVLSSNHKNYESNYKLANKLNDKLQELYPGVSRGVVTKESTNSKETYNQELGSNALLVNIGGVDNTLDEEKRAAKILADVLKKILEE